jgi:hypothetical protein
MNKEQAEEKKQIIKEVKKRIEGGEPKQQILEELSLLYKDKVTIMKQLEVTPSKKMKYKYGIFNYTLANFLLAALILDVILLFKVEWGNLIVDFNTAINVVLDVVFLVGVLLYRIEIYSWIASRALVTLITVTVSLIYYPNLAIHVLVYVSLALILISFILGLFLSVKLCPPRVPKMIEVDIDGNEKIKKTIYVFSD